MRKTHLIIFALSLTLLFLACSCSQDASKSYVGNEGFDGEKLVTYSNTERQASPGSADALVKEIEDFKSFNEALFSIWGEHIDRSSQALESFNRNDISLEKKIEYAAILSEYYLDFKRDIESLTPPEAAFKAYDAAVKAINYRVLFFEKYTQSADISELNELENMAYLAEALFWEELDEVYRYFEERTDELSKNERMILAR
jgi:hypothetical protein